MPVWGECDIAWRWLGRLFALQFSVFAGCTLGGLRLAVQPDQDGERPVFFSLKGQGDLQRKDHEVVAEGEDGVLLRRAQGVVVHAYALDVAPGFARQAVFDGADQVDAAAF
jgi:hypothetical protein